MKTKNKENKTSEKQLISVRKYFKSEKGKKALQRAMRKYNQTEKGKECTHRSNKNWRAKNKDYMKNRRLKAKQEGLCTRCFKEKTEGNYTQCNKCLARLKN